MHDRLRSALYVSTGAIGLFLVYLFQDRLNIHNAFFGSGDWTLPYQGTDYLTNMSVPEFISAKVLRYLAERPVRHLHYPRAFQGQKLYPIFLFGDGLRSCCPVASVFLPLSICCSRIQFHDQPFASPGAQSGIDDAAHSGPLASATFGKTSVKKVGLNPDFSDGISLPQPPGVFCPNGCRSLWLECFHGPTVPEPHADRHHSAPDAWRRSGGRCAG